MTKDNQKKDVKDLNNNLCDMIYFWKEIVRKKSYFKRNRIQQVVSTFLNFLSLVFPWYNLNKEILNKYFKKVNNELRHVII